MARRKKPGKDSTEKADRPSRVRFELEADAEDLFLNHLQQFKPEKTEADEQMSQEKKPSKARRASPVHEIDLHGLTLEEAQMAIRTELDEFRRCPGMQCLKIITGKGHHSQKGISVLAKEIHGFVLQVYRPFILEIEASPDDVRLNGIPLRGHFHLTLIGKTGSRDNER